MSRKTKYVMSGGLAFSEEEDMQKLSKYAKEGWILDKITFMGYKLRKEESQDLIYNIDYQVQPNEDYFEFFEGANWTHVCSSDHIHIFSAPEGTTPIYSDKESSLEKYTKVQKQMFKGVFGVIAFATLFYFMIFLSGIGRLPEIIGSITQSCTGSRF